MKLSSWNPFAWCFKPEPTRLQVLQHELRLALEEELDAELLLVRTRNYRSGLVSQMTAVRNWSPEQGASNAQAR